MGATFSTVFESEVPKYNGTLGADHRLLLDAREALDRLAKKTGLTSLLAFESYPSKGKGQRQSVKWFEPTNGLAAVDALYEYFEEHPGIFDGQSKLMEELSDLGDEVEAAQKAGVRFRFAIIM